MNYYITGDTHSDFDHIQVFCHRMQTTKEDVLIILGDSGINYYLNERNVRIKQMLDDLPITLFCIHGNHEQRPYAMPGYEEMPWHGGIVYTEKDHPSLLFAKDGEVYDLGGKQAIVIGGAYSVDKYYRIVRGFAWYDNEQPSPEIKQAVEQKLDSLHWNIDYVLSHTCPIQYEPTEVFLSGIDQSRVDKSTEIWLGTLEEKLHYTKWYCGHFHTSKKIHRLQFMFHDIEILE